MGKAHNCTHIVAPDLSSESTIRLSENIGVKLSLVVYRVRKETMTIKCFKYLDFAHLTKNKRSIQVLQQMRSKRSYNEELRQKFRHICAAERTRQKTQATQLAVIGS